MPDVIRTVRVEEFDAFLRFLECCFGHSHNFFVREMPHWYQPDPAILAGSFVVERAGRIVSHVGVYPLEVVTAGVRLRVGGIGAVCTLPEEREREGMSKLLIRAIAHMREQGFHLSGLGGDRQRYGAYGWDAAGLAWNLQFSHRSLDRAGVQPVPLRQCAASDTLAAVERFHCQAECHAIRPRLAAQIRKQNLRYWTAEDGYAVVAGEDRNHLHIAELVSASGREAGMIKAMLQWTAGGEASWRVSSWARATLARVMPAARYWSAGCDWQYRIVDLAGFLEACRPVLAARAAAVRDFECRLVMREADQAQAVTIRVRGGAIEILPGGGSGPCVEADAMAAARLLLGGPESAAQLTAPPELLALLPLPVHIPGLDHV